MEYLLDGCSVSWVDAISVQEDRRPAEGRLSTGGRLSTAGRLSTRKAERGALYSSGGVVGSVSMASENRLATDMMIGENLDYQR